MKRNDTLMTPKSPSLHSHQGTDHSVMVIACPLTFPTQVWTSWKQSYVFSHLGKQKWTDPSLGARHCAKQGAFYSHWSRPVWRPCGSISAFARLRCRCVDGWVSRVDGVIFIHLTMTMASGHIVYEGREKCNLKPCPKHTPTTIQKHQI